MATENKYELFTGTFTPAQAWAEMEKRGLEPLTPSEAWDNAGGHGFIVIFISAPENGGIEVFIWNQPYFEKRLHRLALDDRGSLGTNMTFVGKKKPPAA